MTIVINDIVYKNVKNFAVRNLDTLLEVKFNDMALLIRDPLNIVRINADDRVTFETLETVYNSLIDDRTTEFEHKTI